LRLYGLGWYKVRGETPQEGFFIFLAWSVGWGGEWGEEGVFLAWYNYYRKLEIITKLLKPQI